MVQSHIHVRRTRFQSGTSWFLLAEPPRAAMVRIMIEVVLTHRNILQNSVGKPPRVWK